MKTPLKLLLLEDDPLDAELNIAVLEGEGFQCDWQRVETKEDFLKALEEPKCEIILADYNLPSFDGMTALRLFVQLDIDIPFILVSGNLGEDLAVEAVKAGATDYVLKDRLSRLAPSVRRALEEGKLRRAESQRRADMELFRELNQAANRSASIRELSEILSAKMPDGLGCLGVAVLLLDAEKKYLETQTTASGHATAKKIADFLGFSVPFARFPVDGGDSIYARAIAGGKMRVLQETDEFRLLLSAYLEAVNLPAEAEEKLTALIPKLQKEMRVKMVALVPLMTQKGCIGLLEFAHDKRFDADTLQRIEAIAEQVTAILARKLGEDQIYALQLEQKLLLDSAGEGIFGVDTKGRYTFLNPVAAALFGVDDVQSVLGQAHHELHHHTRANGKTYYLDECPIYASYRQGEVRHEEKGIFWKSDGSSFPVAYTSTPIKVGGMLTGAVVTFRDISEQVEAAREIARLAEVVEQASATVVITDLRGKIVYANPFFEKTSGFSLAEALGRTPNILKSGVQDDVFYKELWQTISSGGTWQGTFVNKRKDGSLYYEAANIFPIKTPDGEIINYAAVKREITGEVRAQERIKRQLSHLRSLHMIDSTISASMDLALTINVILKQAMKELEVDAADVLLFDPVSQSLSCAARIGFQTGALEHTHLRLGHGLAGRAALSRKRVCISDLDEVASLKAGAPELADEGFVSYCSMPLIAKGHLRGVLEVFYRHAVEQDEEWFSFFETLAGQAAIAIDNATLFNDLQRSNDELRLAYDTTLEGWAHALEMHDMETEDHSRRVTNMTTKLAAFMGMDDEELVHVRRGALLHDIGKMGIPDRVLNKEEPLTDDEWELIKMHPIYAKAMLSDIDFLKPALDIPYYHHEKWDGSGYPLGLRGEAIPLAARIFAVIDVYDALTSNRSYRQAWSKKKTIAYILERSGSHFDPQVVRDFIELFGEEEELPVNNN